MATTTVSTNLSPFITFVEQASTPSTPAAGNGLLYRKTDNLWYVLDDAGTETQISTGVAASYILQSLADAKGDLIIASADNTFAKHTAPANGSVLLADSSQSDGWSSLLHKFDATTAPTANEDTGDGYAVGSLWMDVTNDKAYICLDATSTAAVWTEITGAGGAGDITTDGAWVAKGDLIVGTGENTAAILTQGTDGYVLTADDAEATGLKWAAGASVSCSEAALGADVTMASADTFYDGPSLALNGTYLIIAQGNFSVGGAQDISMKLWNGTTVSASGSVLPHSNTYTGTITVVGYVVTSGSETWKISAASNGTSAKMKAATLTNGSGNNASKIVALKIA